MGLAKIGEIRPHQALIGRHRVGEGGVGGQGENHVVFRSASAGCLDGDYVDLLHRHHRLEGTLCLIAASCKRIG